MQRYPLLTVCCLAALVASGAAAQEASGDPEAGFELASEVCAFCHAISPGESMSPIPEAPSFEQIANTPGMTETWLYAWMTTSHPTMPDIILEPEELTDVVAYILSLQDEQL
jgi:mono/diheme cytochrome c family protein